MLRHQWDLAWYADEVDAPTGLLFDFELIDLHRDQVAVIDRPQRSTYSKVEVYVTAIEADVDRNDPQNPAAVVSKPSHRCGGDEVEALVSFQGHEMAGFTVSHHEVAPGRSRWEPVIGIGDE